MEPVRWGAELWDCVGPVLAELAAQSDLLAGRCARLVRERGELERDYARGLRKLAGRLPEPEQEEGGLSRAFRRSCEELGYQAGQHEILAETFLKTFPQEIKQEVKGYTKRLDKVRKEAKNLQSRLDKSYRALEKQKARYCRQREECRALQDSLSQAKQDDLQTSLLEKLRKELSVQVTGCDSTHQKFVVLFSSFPSIHNSDCSLN